MTDSLKNNGDEVWSDGPVHPASSSHSAFSDANVIDAEPHYPDDESNEGHVHDEHQPLAAEASVQKAPGKANVPLLAGAGVIVLALLSGVGFVVNKKLNPPKPYSPVILSQSTTTSNVFDEPQPAATAAAAGSPFYEKSNGSSLDAATAATPSPAASKAEATPVSATPVVAAAAVPVVVAVVVTTPASATATKPAPVATIVVTPVIAAATSTNADKAKVQAPASAPAKDAVAVAESSNDLAVIKSAKAVKADPKAEKVAAVAAAAPVSPKRERVSRVASSRSKSSQRMVSGNGSKYKLAKRNRSKDSKMITETASLTQGWKVANVYPPAGKNLQAWLLSPSGRTLIVSVGDEVEGGARVTAITGKPGQVVTTAGTISYQGVR